MDSIGALGTEYALCAGWDMVDFLLSWLLAPPSEPYESDKPTRKPGAAATVKRKGEGIRAAESGLGSLTGPAAAVGSRKEGPAGPAWQGKGICECTQRNRSGIG
jgi:hypothetical protein